MTDAIRIILLTTALALTNTAAIAQDSGAGGDDEIEALKAELQVMREAYESQINALEKRIGDLEIRQGETVVAAQSAPPGGGNTTPATTGRAQVTNNAFNPAIGLIFNGRFTSFSADPDAFALSGFPLGPETGPGSEGFALDETELNFSSNVNDLFFASTTAALAAGADGVEVELEEAFIQTLSLPYGMTLKAGRFFASLGYLNENHTHTDNFADRPLPYAAFLAGQYNDDGVQLSVILPTDIYVELGAGLFRGDDFPAGGAAGDGVGSYLGFARFGGDIGFSQSWRLGLSYLSAESRGRTTGPEDADPADLLTFDGDTGLFAADVKYVWSPDGNNTEKSFIFQAEYMRRSQQGEFNGIAYDGNDSGWYAEGVYKFTRGWRTGYRFSRMNPEDNIPAFLLGTALDSGGRSPSAHSFMVDWARNDFSVVRLQLSHDRSRAVSDDRIYLQYIMAIGAHGAHKF